MRSKLKAERPLLAAAKPLTIGKLAQRAEVGVDTVRFYERAGLLPATARSAAGYRLYGEEAVARLRFIRRARAHGFSLQDAAELLRLSSDGSRRAVRKLAEQRLADLNTRIAELTRLRNSLHELVAHCDGVGTADGCPIVAALVPPEAPALNDAPPAAADSAPRVQRPRRGTKPGAGL